jgi:lysyl-tRNA synthetase class 2
MMQRFQTISLKASVRLAKATTLAWCLATTALIVGPGGGARVLHHVGTSTGAELGLPWREILDAMLGCIAGAAVLISRGVAHRTPDARPAVEARLRAVQAIVDRHGIDSLAPFIVRRDKCFEMVDGGVVAYRRIGTTLVVSGDPVGERGAHERAIARLRDLAARDGLGLVVYGASRSHLGAYRHAGMRAVCVGEEAVVAPASFSLEGRAVRKLRQSVQRIQSRGWTVCAIDGRHIDEALEAEIDAVEREWRARQAHVLGFAMSLGEHEHGVRPNDLFLLARCPEGQLRAVMRFLAHRGNLSLDTMRRVGETPNGLNEALVCEALAVARDRAVAEVSLNYAGLAHLLRHPARNRVVGAARRWLLARLSRHFQMERLIRFNDKFGPEWRPRYLVYASRRSLPLSVYRVLQAEGYLRAPRLRRALAEASQPGGGAMPEPAAGPSLGAAAWGSGR